MFVKTSVAEPAFFAWGRDLEAAPVPPKKILKIWKKFFLLYIIANKYLLKLEVNNEKDEDTHLRKLILHIENLIRKKLDMDENEFKSIIKNRGEKTDLIECKIKTVKNNIITKIEYEDKTNNYLKTIFDLSVFVVF